MAVCDSCDYAKIVCDGFDLLSLHLVIVSPGDFLVSWGPLLAPTARLQWFDRSAKLRETLST